MAAPTPVIRVVDDSAHSATILYTIPTGGDTDLSAQIVVDVSALTPAASLVSIQRIRYAFDGFSAKLLFDASTDVHVVSIGGFGTLDFSNMGDHVGLTNNAGAGITGDILITTNGIGTTDSGTLIIDVIKTVLV